MTRMTPYRHTQIGWAILVPILIVLVVSLGLMNSSTGSWPRHLMPVAGILSVVLILFATLTVKVTDGWLECRFGVGLIWRRIRLAEVQRVETVRNKWYYGWGIRLTPHGWLWNVAGLDAVELTFTNGKKFRIGTDDSKGLLEAIRASQPPGNRPA